MPDRAVYEPDTYWREIHTLGDIRAVGQDHLSAAVNDRLYQIGRRNLLRFLKSHALLAPPPTSVFEAGAGTGFWVREWLLLGAQRVDGCDLADAAVDRLRAAFPESEFTQCDISTATELAGGRKYGLVTALNVLLHITDEEGFDVTMGNLSAAVAPGGHLLIADAALRHRPFARPRADQSSTARPIAFFEASARRHGLVPVAVGPSAVIGANPIDIRSDLLLRLAQIAWGGALRLATRSRVLGAAIGFVIDLLDRAFMRTGSAPSGKFLLFKRPDSP